MTQPPTSAASLFAALGDPTRLAIVTRLAERGPQSTSRLTEAGSVTRQAVTKHLLALSQAGFVGSSRFGRERVWELRPERVAEVGMYLEQISAQWDAALARLRVLVEGPEGR